MFQSRMMSAPASGGRIIFLKIGRSSGYTDIGGGRDLGCTRWYGLADGGWRWNLIDGYRTMLSSGSQNRDCCNGDGRYLRINGPPSPHGGKASYTLLDFCV